MRHTSMLLVIAGLVSSCGSARFAFYEPVAQRPSTTTTATVATTATTPTTAGPASEVALPPEVAVYSAEGIVSLQQGTAATWLRMQSGTSGRRDHLVFATDDSRLVLVVDTFSSSSWPREVVRIGARAGGNARDAMHNFPEASILIDNDGVLRAHRDDIPYARPRPVSEDAWHLVAMTWRGYPAGQVVIYLDGERIAERTYDGTSDDGRPPPQTLAIGMRPGHWTGELRRTPQGTTVDASPGSGMSLAEGGIEMAAIRFFPTALSDADVRALARER